MAGLIEIPGLMVGQAQDLTTLTGLTVVIFPDGAVGGATFRGSSTATRQMGALTPGHAVDVVHAVVFTGGSAFGLDAAAGVMAFLEAEGIGLDLGVTRLPVVPTAALFDLRLGSAIRRPDAAMALEACRSAGRNVMAEGSVGAGCGATVGKLYGMSQAMKGGLGTAARQGKDGLIVAGLAAVNAFGDVTDPASGRPIAGTRLALDSTQLVNTEEQLAQGIKPSSWSNSQTNTTLALVATNARLDRRGCIWLASMAEQGLSRAIRPYGTLFDGDLVIALSLGKVEADIHCLGAMACQALAESAVRAVSLADGFDRIPDLAWIEAHKPG